MIDNNKELVVAVKKYFTNHTSIEVIMNSDNGIDALDKIVNRKNDYDIILMDLILPNKDRNL